MRMALCFQLLPMLQISPSWHKQLRFSRTRCVGAHRLPFCIITYSAIAHPLQVYFIEDDDEVMGNDHESSPILGQAEVGAFPPLFRIITHGVAARPLQVDVFAEDDEVVGNDHDVPHILSQAEVGASPRTSPQMLTRSQILLELLKQKLTCQICSDRAVSCSYCLFHFSALAVI